MKSTTAFKDFKELAAIKPGRKPMHPQAFDLDSDDPELDLETWQAVESPSRAEGHYQKLNPDEISVRLQVKAGYRKKNKLSPDAIIEAHEVYIRFGTKVIKQLGWRKGEQIAVFQHPQDKSVYGLMPRQKGKMLRAEGKRSNLLYLSFMFKNEQKLLTQKSKVVEYSIHENGYLLFRLPPQD